MSTIRSFKVAVAVVALATFALGGAVAASATELSRGSGMTATKSAWTWRISRADADAPCASRQQKVCHPTTLTIENTSAKTLACVAQLRFSIIAEAGKDKDKTGAEKPTQLEWTENAGLQVEAGAATPAIVSEFPDKVDAERSFVVCWTTEERDEADDGDAPFARAAPSACTVRMVSSPGLEEYFPSGSNTSNEGGLVSVRIALPLAEGPPKVLGVNASSGFLRIDRAALLVASRMSFKTNCPGTQRLLPIRFQLK